MKLLALDTSTEACSAAVLVNDEVIERFELVPRAHGQLILTMIDAVMAEAELEPRQLDALAFGRGPGAFTGVRIATGVVQGIAFAADLPVVPVSTLAAIALGAIREHGVSRVAAALDARMGEVYWGAYQVDSEAGVRLLGQEQVCPPAGVSVPAADDWFGAGNAWAVYAQTLSQCSGAKVWQGDCYPRAWDIALLGAKAWERGEVMPAEQALPMYLRDRVVSR